MRENNLNGNMKISEEEKERIRKILALLEESYPNATTALRYENPFQLLVATILSAQCTDRRVNQVTARLFKKYKGPEDFARAERHELEEDIKECGLFRSKSKNIIETSRIIVEKYGGRVPDEFEELIKLPGVGRKTANVILANAFGKPAFAVDTHVFRVARRLGFSDGKDPLGVEKDLTAKVPREYWIKAHHWLINHGRRVCTARKPKCENCVLKDSCRYYTYEYNRNGS
ncbi:endonuclease III [Thermosediminibacter oceani]|uniref:Endonuclease III n=1 Tax=Thermosediminibacter oceani (strain ATCC BAA-1034 / DSM 16646 / JW/IW-1228P) TaxID=555079 RepID=D9RY35_THEOJ|nr:endonuclease III [Thermosediminibacter oceani]ADL08259.1 endonuclease III; DNA-(apurinic or apyrimidinic site) lyase [Thermosediminibacter oceani DSM 16646]